MSEGFGGIVASTIKSQEEAIGLVEKLFSVAQPAAVYGEPIAVGQHIVITASEVHVGMGYGFGAGGVPEGDNMKDEHESGFGGGGGGGGASGGRPVAAIDIGPEGVRVEPIIDVTKIALAFLTTLGAMFMMLNRMRAAGRKLGD
jgi:uncharacterized spore protein YtfJ